MEFETVFFLLYFLNRQDLIRFQNFVGFYFIGGGMLLFPKLYISLELFYRYLYDRITIYPTFHFSELENLIFESTIFDGKP